MKKLFTILAVICSINGFAQTNTATWHGVLKIAAQELTLQLHVDEAKKEVLLDVLEQGAEGQAMEVVHLTSDSIHVTIPNLRPLQNSYPKICSLHYFFVPLWYETNSFFSQFCRCRSRSA